MAHLLSGIELGTALCKALGLDANRVVSVSLNMEAGGMATATVTHLVDDKAAGDFLKVVEGYELQRKPEDPQAKAMEQVARNLTRG
jgi:ribosomal protein S24E